MHKYLIYGIKVSSDLDLYECQPIGDEEETSATIRYDALEDFRKEVDTAESELIAARGSDIDLPNRYHVRRENEELFFVRGIAYFRITNANLLEYSPIIGTEGTVFHQWLLCLGFTAVMIQKRIPVLHGAGLLVPGTDNAIVISGESGAGKSTTSDALLKRGLQFISDDSIGITIEEGKAAITGSYRQRRICSDVAEREGLDVSCARWFEHDERTKWVFDMSAEYQGNVPHRFTKLFCINLIEGEDVTVDEVTGLEKLHIIAGCLYKRLYYKQLGNDPKLMSTLLAAVGQVKVYTIGRPAAGNTIEEITERILELAYAE